MSKKKNGLTLAEDSPWYKFLLASFKLDEREEPYIRKPYGWHWFWGIYFLHKKMSASPKYNIEEIQKNFPNDHWIQNSFNEHDENLFQGLISSSDSRDEAVNALQKLLEEDDSLKPFEKINFSKLHFTESIDTDFLNLIFPIDVSFAQTKFSATSNFTNAIFCKKINFNKTIFSDSVFFDKTQFFGEAIFTGAHFHQESFSDPYFYKAVFSGRALFTYAEFHGKIFFKETTFSRDAIFQNAKFAWLADFEKAKFFESVFFTKATFSDKIKFDGTTFAGHTNFTNTKFEMYVPSFHKADIHSNISWDTDIENWPPSKKPKDEEMVKTIDYNQNGYENLCSYMKGLDKYHDEHFFFRQEMRCRQWTRKNPFTIIAYWLYEKIADYGYGFERALFYWFAHIFIGALFICSIIKNTACSFLTSFANAHGFLPLHNGPLKKCYMPFMENDLLNAIWAFQIIAGIPLLFLLLLTLRIRFRLK